MAAEIVDIKKQVDGLCVFVKVGERIDSILFDSDTATEENITEFARQMEEREVKRVIPQNLFSNLERLKGKKYDKASKKMV